MSLASGLKTLVAENYANDTTSTTLCSGANLTAQGHVATITCDDASGEIEVTMDPTARSVVLTLTPTLVADAPVGWACVGSDATLVPAECR
ncbi:pilin [Pseudomonas sp. JM10B5a]|nr:pilin [Pseudomonas oligotrophica]